MIARIVSLTAVSFALCSLTATASAQALSQDQQEIWRIEQQQWKMAAAKDLSWIDTLLHPNFKGWDTGEPMPRDKASLKHWSRYDSESMTILEHEIFPISATITGDVAVARYRAVEVALKNSHSTNSAKIENQQPRALI